MMKLVVIESPLAGDVERNVRYARAAMRDCLARGEAPFASHLLYAQEGILDDRSPAERARGMDAGFAWGARADLVAVYSDLGISRGMEHGISRAIRAGIPWEDRKIPGWEIAEPIAPGDPRVDAAIQMGRAILHAIGSPDPRNGWLHEGRIAIEALLWALHRDCDPPEGIIDWMADQRFFAASASLPPIVKTMAQEQGLIDAHHEKDD
jgi:hypothetical protein